MFFQKRRSVDVVIMQFEAVHEECMASMMTYFADMGVTYEVFINASIVEKRGDVRDALEMFSNIKFNYIKLEHARDWDELYKKISMLSPKLLYSNTYQRDGSANLVYKLGLPVIGIVHNYKVFNASKSCVKSAKSKDTWLLGLSEHVVRANRENIQSDPNRHVGYRLHHWSATKMNPDFSTDVRRIVIPGAVSYKTREYARLIEYLESKCLAEYQPFMLYILAGGADLDRLKDDVKHANLSDFFRFPKINKGRVQTSHVDYMKGVSQCHASLPLLSESNSEYSSYKVSGGIVMSIGMCVPMIAPELIANVYKVPVIKTMNDSCVDFLSSDLSRENISTTFARLQEIRAQNIREDAQAIKAIVKRYV